MENYKDELIKIVSNVENSGALEYLYTFVKLFLEKWGVEYHENE